MIASRLRLKAFFFIYYDQILNNLCVPEIHEDEIKGFVGIVLCGQCFFYIIFTILLAC